MAKALVTGSFDPITRGHFAMIEMAARIFDEVTVCIFVNPDKMYCFSRLLERGALTFGERFGSCSFRSSLSPPNRISLLDLERLYSHSPREQIRLIWSKPSEKADNAEAASASVFKF